MLTYDLKQVTFYSHHLSKGIGSKMKIIIKHFAQTLLVSIMISSLLGCNLFPEPPKSDPTLLLSTNQLEKSDFQILNEISTDTTGIVELTTSEIPDLQDTIELHITDYNDNPINGIKVNIASVNGTILALISDENNIYQDSIVQVDTKNYDISSSGSHASRALVIGTVIVVVKLGLMVWAAYEMGEAIAEYAQEIHGFHVDNFEDVSLSTITYRAELQDVADLILQHLDLGLAALSLASAISTAGTTKVLASKKMAKLILKEVFEVSAEKIILDFLIPWIAEGVKDLTVTEINKHTEVFLKIHFWDFIIPEYQGGIEIIPILSEEYSGISASEMIGTWGGNWINNTYNSTGEGKISIPKTIDDDTFEARFFNISYDPNVFVVVNCDIDGSRVFGSRTNCPSWIGAETLTIDGSVTGNIASMTFKLYNADGSLDSEGAFTARHLSTNPYN